jgi:hypothetical protein
MSNKLTDWHDAKVRKPTAGERVLVVRKTGFWEAYYVDIAVFDGEKWRSQSGNVIVVTYWHDIPDLPAEEDVRDER